MQTFTTRLTLFAVASVFLTVSLGCDDTRAVDRQVQADVDASRLARMQGDRETAQRLLDRAARADATAAVRAHAKSTLAHAQLDAAVSLINNPVEGVEAGHREITRLLGEIDQLVDQIHATNTLVESYRQYDPAPVRQLANQRIDEVKGGPDRLEWLTDVAIRLPTLAAVTQDVARLQNAVARQQEQINAAVEKQVARSADAARASREADALDGRAAVDQHNKASELRRQSADLANQIDVLQSQLAVLQSDLAVAQARHQALTSAITQIQSLGRQADAGWKDIEQQIVQQQRLATTLFQGVGGTETKASPHSVQARVDQLQVVLQQTDELADDAEQNLLSASDNFAQAVSAAEQLNRELMVVINDPAMKDDEAKKVLHALRSVYNPTTFRVGQANATQQLARLYTARIAVVQQRIKLGERAEPIIRQAGLTPPRILVDPAQKDLLAALRSRAIDAYTSAIQLYADLADESPLATEIERNAGRIGRIFALYGRAQLARALDDEKAAAQFLADARNARDIAMQHNIPMPALPAELATATPRATPATSAGPPGVTSPDDVPFRLANLTPQETQELKAFMDLLIETLNSADMDAVRDLIDYRPDQTRFVDALLLAVQEFHKLEAAATSVYGDEDAKVLTVPEHSVGLLAPMPSALRTQYQTIRGSRYRPDSVMVGGGAPSELMVRLRNVGGEWKVDFATMPDEMLAVLPSMTEALTSFAHELDSLAEGIMAGRYPTVHDAKVAYDERVKVAAEEMKSIAEAHMPAP